MSVTFISLMKSLTYRSFGQIFLLSRTTSTSCLCTTKTRISFHTYLKCVIIIMDLSRLKPNLDAVRAHFRQCAILEDGHPFPVKSNSTHDLPLAEHTLELVTAPLFGYNGYYPIDDPARQNNAAALWCGELYLICADILYRSGAQGVFKTFPLSLEEAMDTIFRPNMSLIAFPAVSFSVIEKLDAFIRRGPFMLTI